MFFCVFSVLFTLSCSKPEKACFEYTPLAPTTATAIIFNGSCSENAYKFTWSFGDNTPDTTTLEKTISHIYSQPGEYEVTLHIERKDGVTLKKGRTTTRKIIRVI